MKTSTKKSEDQVSVKVEIERSHVRKLTAAFSNQQNNQRRFSTFKADDECVAGIEVKSLTAAFESKKIYNNSFSRPTRNHSEPRVTWRRESETAQFVRKSRNSLPGDRRGSTDSEGQGYEGASDDSPFSTRRSARKASFSISELKEKLFSNQYPSTPDTISTSASSRSTADATVSGASIKTAHPERKFVTAKSDDNITITSSTKAEAASAIPTMRKKLTLPKPTTPVDVSSRSRSPRNVTFASEPAEPVVKKKVVSSPPRARTPIPPRPQAVLPRTKSLEENVSTLRTENVFLKHKVSTSPLRPVRELIGERERIKTSPHMHQPGGVVGVGPRIDGLSRSGKEEPKALKIKHLSNEATQQPSESTTQLGRHLSRAKTCSSIEMATIKTNEQERARHVGLPKKNEKDDVHRQKTNEEQKKKSEPVPTIPSLNLTDLKSNPTGSKLSTTNQSYSPIKPTESKQPNLEHHRSYSNIQSEAASTRPGSPSSTLPGTPFSSHTQYTPSTRPPTPVGVASARIKNGGGSCADRPTRTSITSCGELRRDSTTATQGENVGQIQQALIALLGKSHHVPKQSGPEARPNTTTASTREASMVRPRTATIGTKISVDAHSDTINSRNRPRAATIGHNAEGDVNKSTPPTLHAASSSEYEKKDKEKDSTKRRTSLKESRSPSQVGESSARKKHDSRRRGSIKNADAEAGVVPKSSRGGNDPPSKVEESSAKKKRDSGRRDSIPNDSLTGVLSKSPSKKKKQELPINEPASSLSKVKSENEKKVEKLDNSQYYSPRLGHEEKKKSRTWISKPFPCLNPPSHDSKSSSSQSTPKLMRSPTAPAASNPGDGTVASKNTPNSEKCERSKNDGQGDAEKPMGTRELRAKMVNEKTGEEKSTRSLGSPVKTPLPKTAPRTQGAQRLKTVEAFLSSSPGPGESKPIVTDSSQCKEMLISSPADAPVPRIITQKEGHFGKPSNKKDTLPSPRLANDPSSPSKSPSNVYQKKKKSYPRASPSLSFARDLDHGAVDYSNAEESSKNVKKERSSTRLVLYSRSSGLQDYKPTRMRLGLLRKSASAPSEEESMTSSKISSGNKGQKKKQLAAACSTITKRRFAKKVSNAGASDIFNRFANTMNVADTQSAFKAMGKFADRDDGDEMFPFQRLAARGALPWKAREVWQNLIAQLPTDDEVPKLRGHRVVIVGAGPCGLRAALCLATQGAHVTVLEKRTLFTRKNRLHIWEWVRQDLISWNAKIFNPPGPQFGMDQDYCHIGIYELQLLLLKNCFLLGVEVMFGQECRSVKKKTRGVGWVLETMDGPLGCDIVIGADGPASKFSKLVPGMGKSVALELKNAIGLVVNFSNEKKGRFSRANHVRQFSWSKQFNQKLFKDLRDTWNADLENIVYYRGPETHYLVMTPTSSTLEKNGICHTFPIGPNTIIDHERLRAFARNVGNFFGFPDDIPFLGDDKNGNLNPNEGLKQDCMLFDFSSTKRAQDAIVFTGCGNAPAALVGDAVLEPFWPEGLGIVRGFFSVLDCCHSLTMWASEGQERAQKDAHTAWASLKSLNGHNRKNVVMPDSTHYTMDPRTRYRGFS